MSRNQADTFDVGGETTVGRLGFGAMRLTGEDIVGPPADEQNAGRVAPRRRGAAPGRGERGRLRSPEPVNR